MGVICEVTERQFGKVMKLRLKIIRARIKVVAVRMQRN